MTQTSSSPDLTAPAPASTSAAPGQARRTANTATTEAEWAEAMRLFCHEGWSDADIGLRFNITGGTVARYRFNNGVRRIDWPVVRSGVARPRPSYAPGEGEGWRALPPPPELLLPDQDDPAAFGKALMDHGKALLAAGRTGESGVFVRLARSFMLTARTQAELAAPPTAAFDAASGEDAPELRAAQCAPDGDWKTWLFLGGRGGGKTLAGAAWLAGQAKTCGRLALVGPTYADVREVMIEGPSGLRGAAAAFGPANSDGSIVRPRYEPSRRRLLWPNGAVAQVFTAEEPDGLRGPQFEAAWGDELCAWSDVGQVLAMLRMGLRLGGDPRLCLTTTPRAGPVLARLLGEPGLVVTRGSALDNAQHLAPGFVEGLRALYGGTRLERQEIDGEVIEALEGAVFRRADLDHARALGRDGTPGRFERLVVAVDPPAGVGGSACGIVVAGLLSSDRTGPRAWVLRDATCHGLSVAGWAARVKAATDWAAGLGFTAVVAEANQGGEMVRQVLVEAGIDLPIRMVHARLGKRDRAEPVSLLYEQGRVAHAPGLAALEDQMLLLGASAGDSRRGPPSPEDSPDRADALVWALTALVLAPASAPRVRGL